MMVNSSLILNWGGLLKHKSDRRNCKKILDLTGVLKTFISGRVNRMKKKKSFAFSEENVCNMTKG